MKNKKSFMIISLIIIALFSISVVKKTVQNDTYFSIAVGNKILEHGFYEDEDFTWHEGLKYPNVRWLFDVSVAFIYNNLGLYGIYFVLLASVAIFGFSLFYIFSKLKVNRFVALLGTLLILRMASGTFMPRAVTYSFLIFIWQYYLIQRLLETDKLKYSIILIGLSILLANLHSPIFLMYVVMFLPFVAEYVLNKIKFLKEKDIRVITNSNYKYKLFFTTLILSAFGGIFAPNDFSAYTDALKTINQSAIDMIGEMQKVEIISRFDYFSIALIAICIATFTKIKLRTSDLLYLIGFGVFGLTANRSAFFFIIIGGIVVVRMFDDVCDYYDLYSLKIDNSIKNYFFILFTILITLYSINSSIQKFHEDLIGEESWCPVGAAEYIIDNLDIENIRLFNSFNDGGYLELKGIKVFLDSRAEIYMDSFNNTTVLQDYVDMSYFELQDKYHFTHLLFNKEDTPVDYMLRDADYKVIYSDDSYVLFEYVGNNENISNK